MTLKEDCDAVIMDPDLEPRAGRTYCNLGALRLAQARGCREFDRPDGEDPMTADEMYEVMAANRSGRWYKTNGEGLAAHALLDGLGFAVLPSRRLGEAHGHIAGGYPAPMGFSGTLNKKVPMVANVGKQDREEKATEAFPVSLGEPDYFVFS